MQKEHYIYLAVMQGVGASILNFFINTGIAFAMYYSLKSIPLWGIQGIMADLLGTIFILTFITTLIVTPMTYKTIAMGKLPVSLWKRSSNQFLKKLPDSVFKRAFAFGVVFLILLGPIVSVSVMLWGVHEMELYSFLIFKGTFASVLAGIVTPVIALAALGDEAAA